MTPEDMQAAIYRLARAEGMAPWDYVESFGLGDGAEVMARLLADGDGDTRD